MTKTLCLPDTRLVCLGGARAATNGLVGEKEFEPDLIQRYDP